MGVPVGVRASLSLALARGRFDVVHGFEPGLPASRTLPSATRRRSRPRPSSRPNASAIRRARRSEKGCSPASTRSSQRARPWPTPQPSASPAATSSCLTGSTPSCSRPPQKKQLVVLEWRQTERPLLRALVRELAQQPGWELVLLRTRVPGLSPRGLAPAARTDARTHGADRRRPRRDPALRGDLRPRAGEGLPRLLAEAQTAGAAIAAPPGRAAQPELAAAETGRMIEDEAFRARRADESLAAAETQTTEALADRVEGDLRTARRPTAQPLHAAHRPRARLDRRRPPPAHELVARLLDRRRRPPRPRRGSGPRRDRGDRPQRLRRSAGSRRESAAAGASSSSPAKR